MKKVPRRLELEPLVEVIWQVKFEPQPKTSVGDLLPGVLYSTLKATRPGVLLHPLPAASIPSTIARNDPNLRFAPKYRLEDPESPILYQVGDRFVGLHCKKPYVGWERFKELLFALMETLKDSGLVPVPQSHSLRYIDLLTLDPAPDLSALQLDLTIGKQVIASRPMQLRLELPDEHFTHVLQIATPAQANLSEGPSEGTIIDLETSKNQPPIDWPATHEEVNSLHDRCKDFFFQNILTEEAILKLKPEY